MTGDPGKNFQKYALCVSGYLFIVVCWSIPTAAQQRIEQRVRRSIGYGFVSPNTQEGLKLEEAIRYLSSPEEQALIRETRRLSCIAGSAIAARKAVGSWSDGAEHSVLLQSKTDERTLRYMLAMLGRKARQKAVLYFSENKNGAAVLYSFYPQRRTDLGRASRTLDATGVEFRTLVPMGRSVAVYVVDITRQLTSKVMAAARRLRARVIARRGRAEFIGDDSDREKAQLVFDKEINEYESAHPALIRKCEKQTP